MENIVFFVVAAFTDTNPCAFLLFLVYRFAILHESREPYFADFYNVIYLPPPKIPDRKISD